MNNDYQILIAAIATACTISTAEAEENLRGTITQLQELKLENDFRSRDLADECEGLLGKRYDKLFFAYETEQLDDDNIPQELKDKHAHEDEDCESDYFNPFEWSGMLGEDCMEDVINAICY